ncbi:AraC family transcriptional regulator [Microbacterium foliorum]
MSIDALEDVLSLVEARGELSSTLTGHGDWAVRFPAPAGAKFNSVLTGSCTLDTDGLEYPLTLRVGDSILLTRPQEFVLATSSHAVEQPASPLFRTTRGRSAEVGPADQPVTAALIGCSFTFDRRARELLLDALPPVIHLPSHAEGAVMAQHLLTRIGQEASGERLGAGVIGAHLAVVLLIDLIRHHLAQNPADNGWLHGLTDPVTAAALRAIHADPAARWTVQLLADEAHVSRSTLAARFKTVVGLGPLEYLTRWRLEVGAHRLATTEQTIARIAEDVGYGSQTAFALAFKRRLGVPPGGYRRVATQGQQPQ